MASASPPPSLVPPAPAPRPVIFSFAQNVDLYQVANYLFVVCASGYLLGDLSRVCYPVATINETRGSNWTNALFMFFSLLYVLDCVLYFVVYNQWEREALEEAERERVHRGEEEAANRERDGFVEDEKEEESEHESMLNGEGGAHKRRLAGAGVASDASQDASSGDFASRIMSESSVVARKARWCFFAYEGGLVNVMEIAASLIIATGATMTFFAGIAAVDRIIQRRWDSATMLGDAVASAIFFSDSLVFHHIYVRTLQPKNKYGESTSSSSVLNYRSNTVSCIQRHDPYFWSSILNVLASGIYFSAAVWGILRQNAISSLDNVYPKSYYNNMLPMLQKLHAMYFAGDILYVACGSILVYAYSRDRRRAFEIDPEIDDPDGSGDEIRITHQPAIAKST